ncbi:Chitin binding protein [Oopsacas minuta]|uniref:Chitin binding protein n=1 Tax=Oopsacas minuta TaxID=111878 RepID=A0AAV7JCF0_9METZ|nr:Chitin binding protein [Oopsacas minuta]
MFCPYFVTKGSKQSLYQYLIGLQTLIDKTVHEGCNIDEYIQCEGDLPVCQNLDCDWEDNFLKDIGQPAEEGEITDPESDHDVEIVEDTSLVLNTYKKYLSYSVRSKLMYSKMSASRVWYFILLFLSSIIITASIVTQDPALACVGDRVTVSCNLSVPNPGDIFLSSITDYIVGNSDPISSTVINSNGTAGGVNLSKLTAESPFSNGIYRSGTITLLSYTLAYNGLTLGCGTDYFINGESNNRATLTETINIQQAAPPSPPVPLTADFNSTTCSGTVELSWTPGASDRPIQMYYLYLNGVLIDSISSVMDLYSHGITIQRDTDYNYSVVAMSCAGNSTEATADVITLDAPPPSPPVNLSANLSVFDSITCSGTVELSWIPGASNKPIQMYFLFLNGIQIDSISPDINSYSHVITLQGNTEYIYSIVAMSCAGNSINTTADTITLDGGLLFVSPPSSPPVTLSESNNNCTNIVISWTTPVSDRDIIEYSVYRNNTFLITTTDNNYTDTNQLTINTVYEYSVTAISCAGDSTPGVTLVSIGGYELSNDSLALSFNNNSLEAYLTWTLKMDSVDPILITYSLNLYYFYTTTQKGITSNYSDTYPFTQLSTDTNFTQAITTPDLPGNIYLNITAYIQITEQCGQQYSGIRIQGDYHTDSLVSLLPAVIILIVIIIIILIISISVIAAMSIVIVIMYRKIQSIKSTDKPTEPAHNYQYIDMDKLTPGSTPKQEDPYYTPMSPTGTESRPDYGNLK